MKRIIPSYKFLHTEFANMLNITDWQAPNTYEASFNELINNLELKVSDSLDLETIIVDSCIDKLDVYHRTVQNIIDECAKEKVYFNYLEKCYLADNIRDKRLITAFLRKHLLDEEIIASLTDYIVEDINTVRVRVSFIIESDDKWSSVINSIFARFLYSLFKKEQLDKYYSRHEKYDIDYFKFLRIAYPEKFERGNALSFINVNRNLYDQFSDYKSFIGFMFSFIRSQYDRLNNHCYMSVYLDKDLISDNGESLQWRLYSDIVLFAEKHIAEDLKIGYFHPDEIKKITHRYIKELNDNVDFDIAYSGFTYKDCYVIADGEFKEIENLTPYSLAILFQKNQRDEDVIPCPACRSLNVRGNSYPVIGVKSWECKNPLCPDKSKYNRGKRYSFASIVKQESIASADNVIDKKTIGDWRLDVVCNKSLPDLLEMLIKEYSFVGDCVTIFSDEEIIFPAFGRHVDIKKALRTFENPETFWNNGYFRRFIVDKEEIGNYTNKAFLPDVEVYQGSCFDVLSSLPECSIQGAVTSPPYYNAKEYSKWDNIYCYLYDMYNQAKAVYRLLTPGAYFLYNIFDYFDNEKNLVFSDMGNKRMILGAYIINMFRRIGFEIVENTIWYKGHIQGNRSNNQGNNSPYYQAPLNCYEHIFVFRKPSDTEPAVEFPKILNSSPVKKYFRGKNILGHDAPFPVSIPNILLKRMNGGTIVDPYSGSFTTARAALKYKVKSLSVEISEVYCRLGMRLTKEYFDREISLSGYRVNPELAPGFGG